MTSFFWQGGVDGELSLYRIMVFGSGPVVKGVVELAGRTAGTRPVRLKRGFVAV